MALPRAWVVALALALVGSGGAIDKGLFYKFGRDAGDSKLPNFDDISSAEISLKVPIIYFGQIYNSLYVNSNGFISFLTEIPQFFNIQFPLEYPMVAPLYSDVDTTKAGNVWYRETSDPTTIGRLTDELRRSFSAAHSFTPTGAFIVTWEGVGPYSKRTDRVNTYQLVMATDGEESYGVFLYAEGGLQWLQGDGKNPSMPDARGQAGLISGDGRFTTLKGSGTDQVRNLDKWSNAGHPGTWIFRVGKIAVDETVFPPDLVEGDDYQPSAGTSSDKPGTCALDGSVCHSSSSCVDYVPGFCCQCLDTHFGNGLNCLPKDEPLRVTGKVTGTLNGEALVDSDLHSYVLTAEGRTYTAISRVPPGIGYDIQSMTSLGMGVAWLFAKSVGGVDNGFSMTGAVFNRSTEVDFPQTGHHVTVVQHFMGLDVFNNVQVKTVISGSIPTIPLGSKIEMDAFNEEYTRVKPGQLRARSSRMFRLKGQTIDTPYSVETTVDFDECTWRPHTDDTLRLKVAENIFIQYDAPEQIVRYALSSKIAPLDEPDPCVEGKRQCGQNSQCVVDGDNYRCVCERGYEEVYDSTLNQGICLDVNECTSRRHTCHQDATCINTPGGHTCTCNPGFTGDGRTCNREASCEGIPCDPNAVCDLRGAQPKCTCRPGFVGDGFVCTLDQGESEVEQQRDCIDADICSLYADCLYDDQVRGFRCVCAQGYTGDGVNCERQGQQGESDVELQRDCIDADICSLYADCLYNDQVQGFRCVCAQGYIGDGVNCKRQGQQDSCRSDLDCSPDALCLNGRCECQQGFVGDGYICTYDYPIPGDYIDVYDPQPVPPRPPPPEEYVEPECLFGTCWCPGTLTYDKRNNRCVKEDIQDTGLGSGYPEPVCGAIKCACPQGFTYNSIFRSCEPDFAEARPLATCFSGVCSCPWGYKYDESWQHCTPADTPGYDWSIKGGGPRHKKKKIGKGNLRVSCNDVNNCHANAQCIYDSYSQQYMCQCNVGYEGDGYSCNAIEVSCDVVDLCHIHATCLYDDYDLRHVCVCLPGYHGDGLVCTPQDECSSVSDCDSNAQCRYEGASQRYKCQCNEGYEGDGRTCAPKSEASCNIVNNCDYNADCIYDSYSLRHRCQCRSGYDGDGTTCTATQVGCNVVYNCAEHGECAYDIAAAGYRCRCKEGFNGDGHFCKAARSCRDDPGVCHPKAQCQPDSQSPFGYACRCLRGYAGDGHTCQEAPDYEKNLLFVNQGLSVLRMPADPRSGLGYPIHVEPFMTAVGADVDCLAGRYVWTDVGAAAVRSSNYDGTDKKPIVAAAGIGSPEDVAVDWVSGNVYWTDSVNDVVAVANIENGKRRTVIENGLVNPRGIAVHPGRGLLFWSDWNRLGPKIEVSGLDGTNRRVLVDQDISLPNSLVVDYNTQTLCWADAGTHKIDCIGVDGVGRRTVMEGALYPFGLTLLGEDFYYTDWNDTKIHVVNLYTGLESPSRHPPPGGSGKLYGIVAVPYNCPPVSNVCGSNNGNCPDTHLCLPNGRGGRTCACPTYPAPEGECHDYNY